MSNQRIPTEIKILVAGSGFVALGYGIIAPVLPVFAKSFDVKVTEVSLVVSTFSFVRLLFAPASGWLADNFGQKRTYLAGTLIVSVSSFATAFAQNYWQLVVFRGMGGVGSVCFSVSAAALIVKWAPVEARGRASAAYASAFLIGNLAGPMIGGLISEQGVRLPFTIYGFCLLCAAAVIFFKLPDSKAENNLIEINQQTISFREALKVSKYRAALIANFANGWVNLGLRVAVFPLLASTVLGFSRWLTGVAIGVGVIANMIAINFSGRLSDRYGRRPFILMGLALSGSATLIIGWVSNATLAILLVFISGFGSGLAGPVQQAVVADVIGRERNGSQVLAVFQMNMDLGVIFGPIITGLVIDHFGYGLGFTMGGIVLFLAMIPWILETESNDSQKASNEN